MKNSTKRKWKKGLAVRAAALTCFFTILLIYGTGVYFFQDFIFLAGNRDPVTPSAAFMMAQEPDSPILICQPHLEIPHSHTSQVQREHTGYVTLPDDFADHGAEYARTLLESYGIRTELVPMRSVKPEGDVLQLSYAGFSDGMGYHINPDQPVVLTVSGDKPAMVPYTGENMVFLTFDDGPSEYTEEILDVLGLAGIPATFFTLGKSIEKYPDTARRMAEEGHLLASHGATHEYTAIYQSPDALYNDVRKWEKLVSDLGILPSSLCFRFPGGSVNPYTTAYTREKMINGLHQMGYRIFDWNIVTQDSLLHLRPEDTEPMAYLRENFLDSWETSHAYPVKILLLHDNVPETLRQLSEIIDYVKKQGYTFGTLDMLSSEYYMK